MTLYDSMTFPFQMLSLTMKVINIFWEPCAKFLLSAVCACVCFPKPALFLAAYLYVCVCVHVFMA